MKNDEGSDVPMGEMLHASLRGNVLVVYPVLTRWTRTQPRDGAECKLVSQTPADRASRFIAELACLPGTHKLVALDFSAMRGETPSSVADAVIALARRVELISEARLVVASHDCLARAVKTAGLSQAIVTVTSTLGEAMSQFSQGNGSEQAEVASKA